MIVEVTRKDIDLGIAKSRHACPVALAVRRATKTPRSEFEQVSVTREGVCHGFVKFTRASRRLRRFIKRFDDQKPVEPFKFRLRS